MSRDTILLMFNAGLASARGSFTTVMRMRRLNRIFKIRVLCESREVPIIKYYASVIGRRPSTELWGFFSFSLVCCKFSCVANCSIHQTLQVCAEGLLFSAFHYLTNICFEEVLDT